ncbi:hypothetical protein WN51_01784 [Melipona quadrifasciata]|uniref:Uncharacterized protein n=1 Tax=Melipona quadrifasciata TaxID=166423 RepID=A0A0N0BFA5_9HYME|nr:hypothetical protein WN51_01784 [Melipona quadrifasciata]
MNDKYLYVCVLKSFLGLTGPYVLKLFKQFFIQETWFHAIWNKVPRESLLLLLRRKEFIFNAAPLDSCIDI